MKKETGVDFLNPALKCAFESLKSGRYEDKKLYSFISRAMDDLKENPSCGTKLPGRIWPKSYLKKYPLTNLWKYDLPNGWRMIYSIETDEVRIISIILEWFDHKGYEQRFGYQKK